MRALVQRIQYATVATVSADGNPWNSPVYVSYDDNGNFFWASAHANQHSLNIAANGRAFLVIYDSTIPEGTGVMGGVYIEADVVALDSLDEIAEARRHTSSRINKAPIDPPEAFLEGGVRKIYRATPKRVWTNDIATNEDGDFIHDLRVELPLDTLCGLVTW